MNVKRLLALTIQASTVAMLVFLYVFVSRNAPGITALLPVTVVVALYGLINLVMTARFLQALNAPAIPSGIFMRVACVLCSAVLLYLFVDSTLTDYYQPLSLYDEAIVLLAIWWGLLIVTSVVSLFFPGVPAPALLGVIFTALLAWPVAASLPWINVPSPGAGVSVTTPVFVGGERDYATYRIPALVLIPRNSHLANGEILTADRLLAFSEARRDGALDDGVIDLVLKTSDDSGVTWSQQRVVCTHRLGKRRGKCGNPTPVYDAQTGSLLLAYNLSGLPTDKGVHRGRITISEDGGASWGEPRQLSSDNLIFGPGKGVQKRRDPHAGRLLLPGYIAGEALLLYSDDAGASWHRGGTVAGGNETDVAELANGDLYLTTRHNVPLSRAPLPNGRLFSVSSDGGVTWPTAKVDVQLPTPVCQASVTSSIDGGVLFSNPAHVRSRARMTVRYSGDAGGSWSREVLVYPGPAGYSVLAQANSGDVFLLYENGNMSYSERISLARIPRSELLTPAPSG